MDFGLLPWTLDLTWTVDSLDFAFAFSHGLGSLVPWWTSVGLPRTLQAGASGFLGIPIWGLDFNKALKTVVHVD